MKWVTFWGNAQSTIIPQPATYAKNITFRYPIFSPFNGNKIKITLDNFCCDEDVKISCVTVSISDKFSDEQGEVVYVTFDKQKDVCIKAHQAVTSDEIFIDVKENKFVIVSFYIEDFTKLTSAVDIVGPLSKGYFAYGNQIESKSLDINLSKSTSWVHFLSNIDIYTDDDNYALICYGDSITSQDWPDYLLLKLREDGVNNVSVIRKAVSGTRVLRQYDCILYQSYGLSGKNRFIHEISSVKGAKKIIIQHGINDIIHPVGIEVNIYRPMSDMPTLNELIDGIKYYVDEAKKYNLDIYLGTLLPIYGWRTYNENKEKIKNEFNNWILKNNCIDFQSVIGYFDGAYKFLDGCDSGDHLHPSKKAYQLMANLAKEVLYGKKDNK